MEQFFLHKAGEKVEGLDEFLRSLRWLKNGDYTIILKRKNTKRSLSQNDLMWLWFTCIQDETGTPKEYVYKHYCKKFLMINMLVFNHQVEFFYKTSSELTKEEMTEFLNNIQADAATELGITLPNPEDRYFELFQQQYSHP